MQITDLASTDSAASVFHASGSTSGSLSSESSFAASFQSALDDTGSATSTGDNTVDGVTYNNSGEAEFMAYAHETPAQRFFDNWLSSEGISKQDYKSMSPQKQEALHEKFERQMEAKMQAHEQAQLTGASSTLGRIDI